MPHHAAREFKEHRFARRSEPIPANGLPSVVLSETLYRESQLARRGPPVDTRPAEVLGLPGHTAHHRPDLRPRSALIPRAAASALAGLVLQNNLRPAWWLVGAALSLGLNYIFVERFGPIAAAITATVSFAVISAGVMWSSQKVMPLELPVRSLMLISALLLATGQSLAQPWHRSPVPSFQQALPSRPSRS